MTFGSGPITAWLAAYRAGQPPGRARAAAMPDRVSPGRTTYRAGGDGRRGGLPPGGGAGGGADASPRITRVPRAALAGAAALPALLVPGLLGAGLLAAEPLAAGLPLLA